MQLLELFVASVRSMMHLSDHSGEVAPNVRGQRLTVMIAGACASVTSRYKLLVASACRAPELTQ